MVNLQFPDEPVDRFTFVFYEVFDCTWTVYQRRMTYYVNAAYSEHDPSDPERFESYARIVDEWMTDTGRIQGWKGVQRFLVMNARTYFTTEGEAYADVRARIDARVASMRRQISELEQVGNQADEQLYLLGLKTKEAQGDD